MTYLRNFLNFCQTAFMQRYVISQLVKRDFQNKYLASFIGLTWAFIQPLATILVMWFAFKFGLKIQTINGGLPFVPWLICGLIPWFFISETLSSSTNSLIEYSYLIKKTSFKIAVIPFIKIFTALIIHLFLIGVLVILNLFYGFFPNIYWIQIIYLVFATFLLLTGIGWLLSSINVFVRDVAPLVNLGISIFFWATPIIWPYSILTGNLKYVALLNPFFYIIEGYRYTFLQKSWIFQNIEMTIYFWTITGFLFVVGALVFKRLSPHFNDII